MEYEIPSGRLSLEEVDRLVSNAVKFFSGDKLQRSEKAWNHVWDVLEEHESEIKSWKQAYALVVQGLGAGESLSSDSRRKMTQEKGYRDGTHKKRNLRVK